MTVVLLRISYYIRLLTLDLDNAVQNDVHNTNQERTALETSEVHVTLLYETKFIIVLLIFYTIIHVAKQTTIRLFDGKKHWFPNHSLTKPVICISGTVLFFKSHFVHCLFILY